MANSRVFIFLSMIFISLFFLLVTLLPCWSISNSFQLVADSPALLVRNWELINIFCSVSHNTKSITQNSKKGKRKHSPWGIISNQSQIFLCKDCIYKQIIWPHLKIQLHAVKLFITILREVRLAITLMKNEVQAWLLCIKYRITKYYIIVTHFSVLK